MEANGENVAKKTNLGIHAGFRYGVEIFGKQANGLALRLETYQCTIHTTAKGRGRSGPIRWRTQSVILFVGGEIQARDFRDRSDDSL